MKRKTPAKASLRKAARRGWTTRAVEAALEFTQERSSELKGFLAFSAAVVLLLSLIPKDPNLLGVAGRLLFRMSFGALGLTAYLLPFGLGAWGLARLFKLQVMAPTVKLAGGLLALLALDILLGLALPQPISAPIAQSLYWGGILGHALAQASVHYLAATGTVLLSLVLLGVALFLLEKEGWVKALFLHAYQNLRIAAIRWSAGRGAASGAAEEGAPAPSRRSKAAARARLAEEADALIAADEPPAAKPKRNKAAAIAAVDEGLAAAEAEVDQADATSMEVDRPLSPEERSRLAEAFFKKRGSIKVSAGGPRVNEQASTQAVTGDVESSPQVASSFTDYQFPTMELLAPAPEGAKPRAEGYQETSSVLERALASFGVSARVVEVCPGPSVTRYELALAPGVKMARVVNLADDIALASKVGSVRIEGPIQGRGTLGVEIPNPKSYPVFISELLGTEEFTNAKHKLVFCVGKDIGGSMVFSNLAEMPHLLVAGATGSGKSVMINAIIVSLLYRAAPDEVKLLMVDPKRVELTPYDNIPHLMRPVIANPKEAAGALRLLVQEMEERYKRLAAAGVRKIDEYNAWVLEREQEKQALPPIPSSPSLTASAEPGGAELEAIPKDGLEEQHRRMPYIVCVIDELADLMMVSANEVESSICRLAQLARAVGIHLVIATQRPSVDVVTGLIKSNLPSRIAFQVASKIDSRTILDGSGAEALLGKGDMLYSPGNLNKALRVQGCLVSNAEVEKVVAHVKRQAAPVFDERFTKIDVREDSGEGDGEGFAGDASEDPLYEDAVRHVLAAGQASTSVLQRRMRIGYGRAANLLDLMEGEGIIGPKDGNRPRKVLLRPEDYSIERPPEGLE